jgi:deazaflavin-dependent oxidoreductase (nitroreductase family)
MPNFGILIHTGRKSGRIYRTPINVFPRPGGYRIVLTYGPKTDWVQNVLASGGCQIETRGRTLRFTNPRIIHDEDRHSWPLPIRFILQRARVVDFLDLSPVEGSATEAADRHSP